MADYDRRDFGSDAKEEHMMNGTSHHRDTAVSAASETF
jgi:hypothetical protein